MWAHGLVALVRRGHPRGDRTHSGRIRTERPNELWGTDASRFWTKAEGWCWFFGAVDHCASDVVGWHVAKKGDRWAALEPVRQGVRAHMGSFGKAIALGLGLRHDWGSQYRARQFQAEIKWLGVRSTPAYSGRTGVQRRRGALHPDAGATEVDRSSAAQITARTRRSSAIRDLLGDLPSCRVSHVPYGPL